MVATLVGEKWNLFNEVPKRHVRSNTSTASYALGRKREQDGPINRRNPKPHGRSSRSRFLINCQRIITGRRARIGGRARWRLSLLASATPYEIDPSEPCREVDCLCRRRSGIIRPRLPVSSCRLWGRSPGKSWVEPVFVLIPGYIYQVLKSKEFESQGWNVVDSEVLFNENELATTRTRTSCVQQRGRTSEFTELPPLVAHSGPGVSAGTMDSHCFLTRIHRLGESMQSR